MKISISRRKFIKDTIKLLLGLGALLLPKGFAYAAKPDGKDDTPINNEILPREAMYYKKLGNNTVQCVLCYRKCVLRDGQRAFCNVRVNKRGVLYTLVYGKPVFGHLQPLYLPLVFSASGRKTFRMGTAGCNMRCKFCHTWPVSQCLPEDVKFVDYGEIFDDVDAVAKATPSTSKRIMPPEQVVRLAQKKGYGIISYVLNEPAIYYEYCLDIAKMAKERGLKNYICTNGIIEREPLGELAKYVDSFGVEVKGFSDEVYKKYCLFDGGLKPVMETLLILKEKKIPFEIVYTVVPTVNDDMEQIRAMLVWIKDNLGETIPVHFYRYLPIYFLKEMAPTSFSHLEKLRQLAKKIGLRYAYVFWVSINDPQLKENLFCPNCDKLVLCRRGQWELIENNTINNRCKFCGEKIYPGGS